ncbi:MAG: HlyD family efflux transporter periplasmic adaptor subunit [Candidatus Latescibacteria bacterium]|nr:HlyD family efflux transporter periplasmic adaptor subunit [Candidatus Latescibacterota bacterium]
MKNKKLISKIIKIILKDQRVWYIAGAILLVIIVFSTLSVRGSTKEVGNWVPVTKGTFYVDIFETGEIRAVNSYNVQAPMEWRMELQITEMVKEGTWVEKGDSLAQFDTTTLLEELDTATDQLKAQEAELQSVKTKQESQMSQFDTDLKIAEYSREASKLQLELLKFESEVRKEDARLAYQKALISFDETETRIRAQKIIDGAEMGRVMQTLRYRQNYVNDLNNRIINLTLRAPISGMVVYNEIGGWRGTPRHKVTVGETVWPRMTVITIPDLTEMESVIRVNEIDAAKIKVKQKALLRLDAFDDRVFSGKVFSVAPLADKADSEEETQIKDYEVIIRIDESDQVFKPGMSSRARLIFEEIPDALSVPIGAVFEKEGSPVVYPRKNFPDPIPVTLGKRNDRFIIIEGELRENDEIALYAPVADAYPLGWFAEAENKLYEKEELLGHLDTIEKNNIVDKVEKKAASITVEIPEQFKQFAEMLEKAGKPLNQEQIKKLASIQPGPDMQQMLEGLLSEEQQNILKTARPDAGNRSERPVRINRQ